MKRFAPNRLSIYLLIVLGGFVALAWWVPPSYVLMALLSALLAWILLEGWCVEHTLAVALSAQTGPVEGLPAGRLLGTRKKSPHIEVYADPSLNALVARSIFGGPGRIFLSQGLLSNLEERELRAVIFECEVRLRLSGLKRRTLAAVLAHRLLGKAPGFWAEALLAGKSVPAPRSGIRVAWQLVGFVMLLPTIRWLITRSPLQVTAPTSEPPGSLDLADASRKIWRTHCLWPRSGSPAFRNLWVFPPENAGSMLLL